MAEEKEKKGFFQRLVAGLSKTRANIVSGIDSIFSGYSSIDDDFYEEIEEMFGSESAIIVSSVTKISNLKQTFNALINGNVTTLPSAPLHRGEF